MLRVGLLTVGILPIPLVAMQFSEDWDWAPFDFVFMGALLFGTGMGIELVARMAGPVAYRAAAVIAFAVAFLLVWSNAAVGLIGDEGNPVNLLYGAVLAVGLGGAVVVRFQPEGMSRVLFAMACVQMLITAIALVAGVRDAVTSVAETVMVNAFFAALWLVSAWLFQKAGQQQRPRVAGLV